MRDLDSGESCVCVKLRDIWEISVPSSHFCCETKTVPKSKKERKENCLCEIYPYLSGDQFTEEEYIQHIYGQLEKNQEVTLHRLRNSWHYILSEHVCKTKGDYQLKRN